MIVPSGKKVYIGGTLYKAGETIPDQHIKLLSEKAKANLADKKPEQVKKQAG